MKTGLGIMVLNEEDRDLTTYPNGPAIISSQDVHCVYKDTDLQLYNGHSQQNLTDSGYPMRIQYEQTAYLYDNELYKDMVILRYKLINMSTDTLRDCWIGMISDNDLKISGPDSGQVNDVAKRYAVDESLNLCITWSDINKGEAGKGFGYLGNSLLESPAVDQNGNIRKDKSFFAPEEQLGLKTTKLFNISEDATILQNLYYQLSSGKHSINIENEDLRLLQSTGPFNMNPNDTAVCAYMINFANTVSGDEATGSLTDIQNLITNVINGRDLYYNKRLISGIEEGNKIPGEFNITNIYPNPADSKVNIEFNVSNDGKVNVELLDVLGNRLNGVNKDCDSGLNQITINTNELPSGNYIIKINNSGTSLTRLLSVLK
ncbi:MAG: T9SS type A sorting domain-containing protein [Ignavibacteriae bacterium]|nr:T9SS type A sorting domain-containing protein [Ignavibacteriota bacterium]